MLNVIKSMLVDVSSFSPSSGQEPLPRQCRPKLVLTGTSIPLYVVSIPLSLSVDNSQHFTCPLIQTNATSEPDNLHSATNFYWPMFQWSGLFQLMDDEWCQNITFTSSEQTILEKLFLEIPYSPESFHHCTYFGKNGGGKGRGDSHTLLTPFKRIHEGPGFQIPAFGFQIPAFWIPESIP